MNEHQAHLISVWYAWGQQDAGIGHNVDAQEFAQHYVTLSREPSFPSVQDAWRTYISDAAMATAMSILADEATTVAGISNEVAAFIAKAIDEAQPTGYVKPVHAPRAENQRPTS